MVPNALSSAIVFILCKALHKSFLLINKYIDLMFFLYFSSISTKMVNCLTQLSTYKNLIKYVNKRLVVFVLLLSVKYNSSKHMFI